MTTSIYGYCGKILQIDLSELRIGELQTMDYADRFLGGREGPRSAALALMSCSIDAGQRQKVPQ